MKILVVNAFFDDNPLVTHGRGEKGWKVFNELVGNCLKAIANIPGAEIYRTERPIIQYCRADGLAAAQYLCDYQNTVADASAKNASVFFDTIDIIFVGGDSSTSPFDPQLMQLMTLLHMANQTNKPCFTCGCAALVDVIEHCTSTKLNILNGLYGSGLENLASFPFYATSNGSSESVFLDDETGDLYAFNTEKALWVPTANCGVKVQRKAGKPTSSRFQPPDVQHSSDSHVRSTRKEVDALQVDSEVKAYIPSKHVQHPILKGIHGSEALSFLLTSLGQWRVNASALLQPMRVLASTCDAPALLQVGNRCILAAEINSSRSYDSVKTILWNFTVQSVKTILDSDYELHRQNSGSLFSFVFGGNCDKSLPKNVSPPISSVPIGSSLLHGPEKVTVLVPGRQGPIDIDDPKMLTFTPLKMQHRQEKTTHRTVSGRGVLNILVPQNPSLQSKLRLQNIVKANGQSVKSSTYFLHEPDSFLNNQLDVSLRKSITKTSSAKCSENEHQSCYEGSTIASSLPPSQPSGARPSQKGRNVFRHLNRRSYANDESCTRPTNEADIGMEILDLDSIEVSAAVFMPHHTPRSTVNSSFSGKDYPRVKFKSPRNKPYNTYKKIQYAKSVATKERNCSQSYQGQYTEVFLSPREKEIKFEYESKRDGKFIGSKDFKKSFGTSMALPLRKEGQIRASSNYDDTFTDGLQGIKVRDRVALRRNVKANQIAGPWKK